MRLEKIKPFGCFVLMASKYVPTENLLRNISLLPFPIFQAAILVQGPT